MTMIASGHQRNHTPNMALQRMQCALSFNAWYTPVLIWCQNSATSQMKNHGIEMFTWPSSVLLLWVVSEVHGSINQTPVTHWFGLKVGFYLYRWDTNNPTLRLLFQIMAIAIHQLW